jgi:hypothetical protein
MTMSAPHSRNIDLSSAAGISWRFQPDDGEWHAIQVPAGGWRAQGFTCDAGRYHAEIPIPADATGQVVRVAFDAVNFGAEVFVGSDEAHLTHVASHLNGWMPFTADLTPYVTPGKTIVLHVNVTGRNVYRRDGKYLIPQGATWFAGLAEGILRGITLQILPPIYIDDIFVRTNVAEDSLQSEVTLVNTTSDTTAVQLRGQLTSWNGSVYTYPHLPDVTVTLAPGERRVVALGRIAWGLGPASYWWPNVPYQCGYQSQLHQLSVTAVTDRYSADTATQRFGFRQFEAQGCHYYLNGVRCNLRGDNQQEANFGTDAYGIFPGFGPPTADNPGWPQAVDNLLRVNFNVMRIHQIPATPYMLDVCDELGLMIVDESPVRGSECQEDFVAGRHNMIAADRALVRRDRQHPSIVLWSAGNETWGERGLMLACLAAIMAEDDTRPIIADGVDDLGWPIINMQHYVGEGFRSGQLGVLPEFGGQPRTDRPYGETECVWPMDNSWQGFAWMATCTRIRRLKVNADIRNYVLNNAWSNYVPGQSPEFQYLEKQIKRMQWTMEPPFSPSICPALPDMWHHPLIHLMQQCFHPVAICDVQFDDVNKRSNAQGDWPVTKPTLRAGAEVARELAVFNDEFAGEVVTVGWELRRGSATGPVHVYGQFILRIPLGEYRRRTVTFTVPEEPGEVFLVMYTAKDGQQRFVEEHVSFLVDHARENMNAMDDEAKQCGEVG